MAAALYRCQSQNRLSEQDEVFVPLRYFVDFLRPSWGALSKRNDADLPAMNRCRYQFPPT